MADKGKAIVSSPADSPIKEAAGLTERERSRSPPAHLRPATAADATATTEIPAATTDAAVAAEELALSDVPPPPAVVVAAIEEPALPQPPFVVQYRCVLCNVNFPSDHSLRGHMHVHTRPPRDSSASEVWRAIVDAHEGNPPATLVAMMKLQLEHEAKKKGTTVAALVTGRYALSIVTGLPIAGGADVETGEGSGAQQAPLAAADVPPPPTEKADTVSALPSPVVADNSIAPPPVVVAATAPPPVVADDTINTPPPAPPAPVETTEEEKAAPPARGDEDKAVEEADEEVAGMSGAAFPKLLDLNLNLPPKEP